MVQRAIKSRSLLDVDSLIEQVQEFTTLKDRIATLTRRQSEVKNALSAAVEQHGAEDDKGHLRLELPEPIAGIGTLQRQRRVTQGFDEDKANEILNKSGLAERCYQLIEVVNDDEVLAAHYEGLLSEEDIDAMYPKTISYAFVPTK